MAELLQTLEQAAINEQAAVAKIEQVFGAGDRPRGPKKGQYRHATQTTLI